MNQETLAYVVVGAFFAVPLAVSIVVTTGRKWVVLGGGVAAGIEWFFAYRSLIRTGEWGPGFEAAFFTGIFAVLVYFGLWLAGVLAGISIRRALDRHR